MKRQAAPMPPYTIDDPITDPEKDFVDVTIDFGGIKRWCFFITARQLASAGDFVDGTEIRFHVGERHMIVVGELNETIVDRVLRELNAKGLLERYTLPLEPSDVPE